MIKLNAKMFKRISTYVNFTLAVVPTVIAYVPHLNGFGIPQSTLQMIAAFGALAVMAAQAVSFKVER